jgi:hypothetical protein
MAVIRSYANGFEMYDYTEELMVIPNVWGLINSLGIFGQSEGITTPTLTIEKITKSGAVILDRVRGDRNYVSKDYTREMHAFTVPHFPLDDYISPKDIQGKRAYGTPERIETLAEVRARKLERIRFSHAQLLEVARAKAITAGTVYAPNGTVSIDWYSSWGISRKEVDFDLDTTTTDVIAKCEEVIAHIQDNMLSGEMASNFVAICSPAFFAKLISHATLKEAYKYYRDGQQILRDRATTGAGPDVRYRNFDVGGILFIEYRGTDLAGTALIPTNDAYFFPVGTRDSFRTYFSPAEKFDLVNTIGQEAYMFEYPDTKGEKIEIQSESNMINVLRRPQIVVRGYTG